MGLGGGETLVWVLFWEDWPRNAEEARSPDPSGERLTWTSPSTICPSGLGSLRGDGHAHPEAPRPGPAHSSSIVPS